VTTVRTPVGAAVDAIQRVPKNEWLGPFDGPQGFPNYPVYVDANNKQVEKLKDAVYCLWDGTFGRVTAKLLRLIGEEPSLVPAPGVEITRTNLLNFYPAALVPDEVKMP